MNLPKESVTVRLETKTIELGRNLAKLKFGGEDKLGLLVEEAIQNYSIEDGHGISNSIERRLLFLNEIGTQLLHDLCFLEHIAKDIYLFLMKDEERYNAIHSLFAPQNSQEKLRLLKSKIAQMDIDGRNNELK